VVDEAGATAVEQTNVLVELSVHVENGLMWRSHSKRLPILSVLVSGLPALCLPLPQGVSGEFRGQEFRGQEVRGQEVRGQTDLAL
jgi:hypothetical protein